ncbi:hypothetical protein D9M72_433630 [compost metagenome]
MQAGLAAVVACPARLRADEPDAGPCRVEVHLVGRGEEVIDVLTLEELRGAVRSFHHHELPLRGQRRAASDRDRGRHSIGCRPGHGAEHVAGAEHAAAVAAKLAEGEGGSAAEVGRDVEAALEEDVAAQPGTLGRSDVEHAARGDRNWFPGRNSLSVDGDGYLRAGDADGGGVGDAQRRAGHGEFKSGCPFRIAQCHVAQPEGQVVHGAARRHAHLPEAGPSGPVLHAGLQAGALHRDAGFGVAYAVQRAGGVRGGADHVQPGDGAQHAEVGFDAVHPGLREGV